MVRLRRPCVNYSRIVLYFLVGIVYGSTTEDKPPQIDFPFSQVRHIVDISQRLHYTVNCRASGHPIPSIEWKRNDQLLDDIHESVKAFRNGTLYFKDFSDNDNAYYQCLATNKFGTSMSAKVLIINKRPATKTKTKQIEPETVIGRTGDPMSLHCAETPHTIPKLSKRWYLTHGTTELRETDRIGTDSQGTLWFVYLEPDDERTYTCGLVPTILGSDESILFYTSVKLVVTPTQGIQTAPKIQYKSEGVKVLLNDSVTLECFFSGRPVPKITWLSNSNYPIEPSNTRFMIHDFGRKMTIRKARQDDEGTFTCTADNGFGKQTHSIFVNVTSPPIKIPHQGLNSVVKSDRHDVILKCRARAAHNENIDFPVWYRNGELLNQASLPDRDRYSFNGNNTELYIKNPNKTFDTACFQCNVSNSEGYAFYDGFLKVIESINITRQPDAVYEISMNDVINISVHATGDNCCSISKDWYLNGVRLTQLELNSPPFIRYEDSDTLLFTPRDLSNETLAARLGHYKCNVSNIYDFQVVEFSISMKVIATVEETLVAAYVVEVWWVALVCASVLIILAVVVIIVVVKTNFPRSTYELQKAELEHNLQPEEELLNYSNQEI